MSKLAYRTCRHLSGDGILCGSPALKGELYCYYHQRDRQRSKILNAQNTRRIARITPRVLDALNLPSPDDPASIRVCIATLMRGILAGLVDKQQAGQALYLIQLATVNNMNYTKTKEDELYLQAITDPEPLRLPKMGPQLDEEPDADPLSPEPISTALENTDAPQLEVVIVQDRKEASTDLEPTICYLPRTLDTIDEEYFTPPKRPEDHANENVSPSEEPLDE